MNTLRSWVCDRALGQNSEWLEKCFCASTLYAQRSVFWQLNSSNDLLIDMLLFNKAVQVLRLNIFLCWTQDCYFCFEFLRNALCHATDLPDFAHFGSFDSTQPWAQDLSWGIFPLHALALCPLTMGSSLWSSGRWTEPGFSCHDPAVLPALLSPCKKSFP